MRTFSAIFAPGPKTTKGSMTVPAPTWVSQAKWTVSGALGKQWLDVSDDYTTWNVGVGYALTDKVGLDVRYHDTDVDGVPGAEDRIVGADRPPGIRVDYAFRPGRDQCGVRIVQSHSSAPFFHS